MPHLGGTGAHQLVDALLAAFRTLHHLVAPKDQAFKFLIALLTMKLKNWHTNSLMGNRVVTSPRQREDKNKERFYLALWLPFG
jgi:hypothetical protein